MSGKYRAQHTPECRERFERLLVGTEAGRRRVETATRKMDEAVVKASGMQPDQDPDESDSKRARVQAEDPDPSGGGRRSIGFRHCCRAPHNFA